MSAVGPSNPIISPFEMRKLLKLDRRARRASVFPLLGEAILLGLSIAFYYQMVEKNRDDVGIRTIGVISMGTKVISLICHYQVMRTVKRNMRNAKNAYRLGWTLLIMKIVCVILEYSILAAFLIIMKASDLVIIGWAIGLTFYNTVLSIVLHIVIEYAFEPLKAYIVELDSKFLPLQPVDTRRAPSDKPETTTVLG